MYIPLGHYCISLYILLSHQGPIVYYCTKCAGPYCVSLYILFSHQGPIVYHCLFHAGTGPIVYHCIKCAQAHWAIWFIIVNEARLLVGPYLPRFGRFFSVQMGQAYQMTAPGRFFGHPNMVGAYYLLLGPPWGLLMGSLWAPCCID